MSELLGLEVMQRALLAALLASVACGVLGTYVVAKRMASMAGGVAHAAFGGIGAGYLLGFPPVVGAAGVGVLAGIVIAIGYRRLRSGIDTLVSMVWAVGMALGILCIQLADGYVPDLHSYLFGNLLYASWSYVGMVAALDVVVLAVVAWLFASFQAVSFDEEFAEVAGARVDGLLIALLALVSLAIVMLIQVVGIILVIALLTIPAAIGRHWATSLGRMMAIATLAAASCSTAGLLLSYRLGSVSPGPLIILLAAAAFGLSAAVRRWRGATAS